MKEQDGYSINKTTSEHQDKIKSKKGLENIFEQDARLLKEAKILSNVNIKSEDWKLQNGYKWVTEVVQVTKTAVRKQKVLRKVN